MMGGGCYGLRLLWGLLCDWLCEVEGGFVGCCVVGCIVLFYDCVCVCVVDCDYG